MNHQTFQKAFDHYITLAKNPSEYTADRLFEDTFRTLVEERSRYLELFKKLDLMIQQTAAQHRDLQSVIEGREKMLSEQAMGMMGLRERIKIMEHELDGFRAREQEPQLPDQNVQELEAKIVELQEMHANQKQTIADYQAREPQLLRELDRLNQELTMEHASIDVMHMDIINLEDEKAVLGQKLRDAQQRILELLNQGPADRNGGMYPKH